MPQFSQSCAIRRSAVCLMKPLLFCPSLFSLLALILLVKGQGSEVGNCDKASLLSESEKAGCSKVIR